ASAHPRLDHRGSCSRVVDCSSAPARGDSCQRPGRKGYCQRPVGNLRTEALSARATACKGERPLTGAAPAGAAAPWKGGYRRARVVVTCVGATTTAQ
ncbi:hypothetical protein GW17_00039024, partial [Ensete ventricosum]